MMFSLGCWIKLNGKIRGLLSGFQDNGVNSLHYDYDTIVFFDANEQYLRPFWA